MNDACLRNIQMLRLLPKAPARISVKAVHQGLMGHGFNIDIRSVQRDLNKMSKSFDIASDGNKDIPGWFWKTNAKKLEIPEMEPAVALSFRMINVFLEKFMPPSTLLELSDYFKQANTVLNDITGNNLSDWTNKIALLSRTQPLVSPKIHEDILTSVYTALLTNKQLSVVYKKRQEPEESTYSLHPHGLVLIDQTIYLVAVSEGKQEARQYALHRFISAEISKHDVNTLPQFNLSRYIEQGAFEYMSDEMPQIRLKLRVHKDIAFHLSETPLEENQTLKPETNQDWFILRATVKNTHQLRWWLLSFGAGIEVVKPRSLRESMATLVAQMHQNYLKEV